MLSLDVVSHAEGYDLAIETTGADIGQFRADGTPLGPPDGGTLRASADRPQHTLLIFPAGSSGIVRWKFPALPDGAEERVQPPAPYRSWSITAAAPLPLFDCAHRAAGLRRTATLRLIPSALETHP